MNPPGDNASFLEWRDWAMWNAMNSEQLSVRVGGDYDWRESAQYWIERAEWWAGLNRKQGTDDPEGI